MSRQPPAAAAFASAAPPRYNQRALVRLRSNSVPSAALVSLAALWAFSCAVPLGPGYTVEKQSVIVHFVAGAEPHIEIRADYTLRNTGNQPLDRLEVRLPPESRVRVEAVSLAWDVRSAAVERRSDPGGDILRVNLSAPWPIKQAHSLHLEYDIAQGDPHEAQLALAAGSFYLPPGAWLAALLPPPGTFASGGISPKEWSLSLRVPMDFAVHATGELTRQGKTGSEQQFDFRQRTPDISPFVVAGRYHTQEYRRSPYNIVLWKKRNTTGAQAEALAKEVEQIAKTCDALFGPRGKKQRPVWIADSPVPAKRSGEIARFPRGSAVLYDSFLLAEPPPDFGFIHLDESGEPIFNQEATRRLLAVSLAKTWLGYGVGHDFFENPPYPLKALPSYAAAIVGERLDGADVRRKMIEENLREFPAPPANHPAGQENAAVAGKAVKAPDTESPAKNLLFFFALEDRFSRKNLHKALQHMVQARKRRGYALNDLISALEQETHQNVAEFVRFWLKHPSIPAEFRARYAGQPALARSSSKEATP